MAIAIITISLLGVVAFGVVLLWAYLDDLKMEKDKKARESQQKGRSK